MRRQITKKFIKEIIKDYNDTHTYKPSILDIRDGLIKYWVEHNEEKNLNYCNVKLSTVLNKIYQYKLSDELRIDADIYVIRETLDIYEKHRCIEPVNDILEKCFKISKEVIIDDEVYTNIEAFNKLIRDVIYRIDPVKNSIFYLEDICYNIMQTDNDIIYFLKDYKIIEENVNKKYYNDLYVVNSPVYMEIYVLYWYIIKLCFKNNYIYVEKNVNSYHLKSLFSNENVFSLFCDELLKEFKALYNYIEDRHKQNEI